MSDNLMADLLASVHYIDAAAEWQAIADDPRFPTRMRWAAFLTAQAILAEVGMDTKVKR